MAGNNVVLPPSLLREIAKVLAAPINGGGGGAGPVAPPDWTKTVAGTTLGQQTFKPVITNDQIKSAYGKNFGELDPKIQAKLNSLYTINASMGKDSSGGGILHTLWHGAGSALNRVGDVLSRGEYAVAEPVKREFNDVVQGKSIGHDIADMGAGVWGGLSGKNKTLWSNVIQDIADVNAGANKGLTAQQAVKQATTAPGSLGKAPGWARWGVGLPADIFLDPANLVGLGEVAKVTKAKDIFEAARGLKTAAKDAADLGAHASITKAMSILSDADKEKTAAQVKKEMQMEGKRFEVKGGFVTKLMKSGNYKTGAEAKRAADRIVEHNLAEHATRTQQRLLDLARDKGLESHTPQELQHDLEASLGLHQDPSTNKWVRVTRQFRAARNPAQQAEQVNRASEAIRQIVDAEHARGLAAIRQKLAETGQRSVMSDKEIEDAVKKYGEDPMTRQAIHSQRFDETVKHATVNTDALKHAPEMQKALKESIEKELAEHPELSTHMKQAIVVRNMEGKDLHPNMHDTPGLAHKIYKTVRIHVGTYDDATRRIADEQAHLAQHGIKQFSVLPKNANEFVHGVAMHELGHMWHHAAGMWEDHQFSDLLSQLKSKFPKETSSLKELAKAISVYAVHDSHGKFNPAEMTAEAFAAERAGQGNEITKFITDYVEKQAKSRYLLRKNREVQAAVKKADTEGYRKYLTNKNAENIRKNARDMKKANGTIPKSALNELDKVREERAASLESQVHTVLTPTTQRRLGVALRGTDKVVSIPGSGRIVMAGSHIARVDNWFNNAFRASVGVPPEVYQMARSYMGRAQVRIEEQMKALRDTWGSVSRADAKRAAHAWVEGRGGITNARGEELTSNIVHSLKAIQDDIETFIPPQDVLRELDHVLPSQLKFKPNGITSIWTDASKTTLKDNWLESGLREITAKYLSKATPKEKAITGKFFSDPTNIIASTRRAAEQAKAFRLLRGDYASALGHPMRKVIKDGKVTHDEVTQALIDRGYKKVKIPMQKMGKERTPTDLKDMLFAPEVADGMTRVYRILNNSSHINDVVTQYDKALRIWKSGVTKFNPGYHERNLFGEVFTSWLGGVKNPLVYRRAMRVLWKHDKRFLDPARVEKANRRAMRAANALMNDPAEAARQLSEAGNISSKPVLWFHGRPLHEDEIWHLFTQQAGLHTGFIATDLGASVASGRFGRLSHAISRVGEGAQTLTEGVEDYARLAHFIDALGKSKFRNLDDAVAEAATEVRKFHHDFQDFTHFETAVMARLVPFYKWTRKNLPLMAETIFTQPGKADKLFTVPAGISYGAGFMADPGGSRLPVGDPLVPQFLQDNGAVPIGHLGKNTEYLDSPLPLLDALKMANDPVGSSAFMVNPALKMLLEEATQHQIGGKQITSQQQYLSTMTPYSNLVAKQQQPQGKLAAVLQFLTGIGLQENTQKRMLSEAIREQQAAAKTRKAYYKSKGFKQSP